MKELMKTIWSRGTHENDMKEHMKTRQSNESYENVRGVEGTGSKLLRAEIVKTVIMINTA